MSNFVRAGLGLYRCARHLFRWPVPKTTLARRGCLLALEELERRELLSLMGNSLFPADNPWNERISNAPVAANSATLVSAIGANTPLHPDFGTTYGGALNGIPFNVVPGTQAKVNVVVDAYASESDLMPVPIPPNAVLEGDPLPPAQNTGDRHLIVYDQDNNVAYELFNASRPSENADGQWHCDSLAFWNMNQDWFRTPGFTSADAAGLPILPGLVRADEVLDQKQINHALRFTVASSASSYLFPASHAAGVNDPTLPPMGARFRLKQSFDISGFSAANQVILQALKDYGMIVADNGSSWYVSGAPSPRWDDNDLHALTQLVGNDFEAVDLTPRLTAAASNGSLSAGSVVTLTGLNFSGGAGKTVVDFGTLPAAQVQVVSDTQILATVGGVPAGGTIMVSVVSPYGSSSAVALQQGGAPQTPTLVSPAGTLLNATPTFTWNAVAGAAYYDVWVDDTTSGQTQVVRNKQVIGNTLTPASPLMPGDSYRWWARAYSSSGAASAWSAPATFTVALLNVPTPAGPTGLIQSASPSFSWSAVSGADYYDLWVNDLSTNQLQVVRDTQVAGTSVTAVLSAGHFYQWWVRALNSSGDRSPWSNETDIQIALAAPTPAGPAGSMQNATPSFSWSAVPGAAYYDLWIDNLTTGQAQALRNAQITGTSFTPAPPLAVASYRWWVRAYVPHGSTSPWSSATAFTVTPLGTVTPIGPAGSIQNAQPSYFWNVVAGADYYDVWVDDLSTHQAQVMRNNHVAATNWTPSGVLTPGHQFQWWVRAMSNNGDYGPWNTGSLLTVALLSAPTLAGPAGTGAGSAPTFTWNAVTGADFYYLWVNDLTTGQPQVLARANVAATSFMPTTALVAGHLYQWWVRALSQNGDYSPWSNSLLFSA